MFSLRIWKMGQWLTIVTNPSPERIHAAKQALIDAGIPSENLQVQDFVWEEN